MIDRRNWIKTLAAGVVWPQRALAQSRFTQLDANLLKSLAAAHLPGLVALVARGRDIHVVALGQMAVGGNAMQRESIFRIASMTRPITAAATMMLIEDGKLSLEQSVEKLLPELGRRQVLRKLDGPVDDTVPARRPITVEDLLTFRLDWGLILQPPGTYPIQKTIADLGIVGFGPPDPNTPFSGDQWMQRLATLPLFAQPGDRWMYTTGADILGVLIARASGMSLGDFLDERIFTPLGLEDTRFHLPQAKLARLVTAYRQNGSVLEVIDEPASGG